MNNHVKVCAKHYEADAAIVWCFDYRFSPALKHYITEHKIKRYDLICVAGGAKNVSSPERASDRAFLLGQLKKSIQLHQAREIVLMTHSDCGAYGGAARFGNDSRREAAFHRSELHKAKRTLRSARGLKKIPVAAVFADFNKLNTI